MGLGPLEARDPRGPLNLLLPCEDAARSEGRQPAKGPLESLAVPAPCLGTAASTTVRNTRLLESLPVPGALLLQPEPRQTEAVLLPAQTRLGDSKATCKGWFVEEQILRERGGVHKVTTPGSHPDQVSLLPGGLRCIGREGSGQRSRGSPAAPSRGPGCSPGDECGEDQRGLRSPERG